MREKEKSFNLGRETCNEEIERRKILREKLREIKIIVRVTLL